MRAMVLVLCIAISAQAQEDQARAHFAAGVQYYDSGRYQEALKEFESAYRLSKRVGFLFNLGVCHERLGHDDEALAAYQGYIGSVSSPGERAEVQGRIDRLLERKQRLTTPARMPPAKKPVWKRGWFWGVLGGAALVVGGGVTVGVVLGSGSSGPRTLNDVTLQ